jgi:hypothetical protein
VTTILRRVRWITFALLFAALVITSCGGGGEKEDAQELLDQAFSSEIDSADLNVQARLLLKGGSAPERPVRIEASGPFRSNDGKLPSVDIDLKIGADGGGQTVQTGFLSTGDRAFIKFQDVYYEEPAEQVRQANEAIGKNKKGRGSLSSLGLDPRSWLGKATVEDDEEVAGTETRHVSGTLDVQAVLRNLNSFVRKSGAAIGGATGGAAPEPLSAQQIREVEEIVADPTFDVYIGKDDDIIRRVSGRLEFTVPEASRSTLGELEGGTLEFSVEFRDVNGDQEISAPSDFRPLSDLTRSLGAGALPGLGGGGGAAREPDPQPQPPADPSPPGDGSSTDTEDFLRYAECLDRTNPRDTEGLERCRELLSPGGSATE